MIRVGLDTNILAYLAEFSRTAADDAKIAATRDLIRQVVDRTSLVAPAQTLGELFVALRRSDTPSKNARAILMEFASAFDTSGSEARTALAAADLVVHHTLQFRDALILPTTADTGCTLLLSEDMQQL
jgi:predicted nucleic acid-binding protein